MMIAAVAACLPAAAGAHHKLSKEQCARISNRMKKLQSRLRQAHSGKQGRRYREQMRELQLQRFRKC